MQAQDYGGSLWALGLRLPDATAAGVESEVAAAALVRTWPMRGTLHWVPAEDTRWMLRLLAARVIARSASRYRQLGLGEADFARARRVLERALEGGRALARREAYSVLERGSVSPKGQRGIHVLGHLAQQGILCLGARDGKQPTFVLLEEWVRRHHDPGRDEALATLACRYFRSHGPAALQDYAWWSGLLAADARRAVAAAGTALRRELHDGVEWWLPSESAPARRTAEPDAALLPPWDEYVVAYKEREPIFERVRGQVRRLAYAVGHPLAVVAGRVCGTWSRRTAGGRVRLQVVPWTRLTAADRSALARAADRYARFAGGHAAAAGTLRTAASR